MGRDYYIVVIRDNLQHEKHNKHCILLDYEPVCKEKYQIEDNLFKSTYTDCKYLDDLDTKHKDDFCQLCRWFLEPACYENEYVVYDYHQIRLPSFRGSYFMDEFLYPSKTDYDYCQEGGGVYWITLDEVEDMEQRMKEIPLPKRESDKQQFEQTTRTLEFLKEWIQQDNTKILYFTEI